DRLRSQGRFLSHRAAARRACRSSLPSQERGGVLRAQFPGGDFLEDRASILGAVVEAHRANELVEAADDGRVRNPEHLFDVFDLAAASDKGLEKRELFAREPREATERKRSFDARRTARALELRHAELGLANRAMVRNEIGHR